MKNFPSGHSESLVAALVNGIVSGPRCDPSSTLGGVRDEPVQKQLFHFLRADTPEQKESL
jgi:hypothetical protein